MQAQVDEMYTVLAENVAETSEAFMDNIFRAKRLRKRKMTQGIRDESVRALLFRWFAASAFSALAQSSFSIVIVDMLPSPKDSKPEKAVDASGNETQLAISPTERHAF
jgi:translation elongation factor EF-G